MSPIKISALLLLALTSCSSSVRLTLKDAVSKEPLEMVPIELYRPVSGLGKFVNPVGAFYHPMELAESKFTDKKGQATFKNVTEQDSFQIQRPDTRPVLVRVWGQQIQLCPGAKTNDVSGGKWAYSIWCTNGVVKHSAWPIREYKALP